ncbi:uncharacterized protein BKCO1_7500049 [Diplodia corticola]|uniref:DUF7924 domain-containing protein n=1 Tax=Diplodia corticola TaxID=236234 RepID=A0A1J9RB92_9PEZI|nr:uncharacterized protein BKCO1_7500049 [Diplodia corticola]OJD29699.1 hypothetical protein BKCO1_7500049 [Diplodia corticola]
MASRKRPRAEHQPKSSPQHAPARSRGKQEKPAEPSASDPAPPRRSSRIKARQKKLQQPAGPKDLTEPAHLANPPASALKSRAAAKSRPAPRPKKGPGKQEPLRSGRSQQLPDYSANQPSQSAPAEPRQRNRPRPHGTVAQSPARRDIDSSIRPRLEARTTPLERQTESWVQSVQRLAKQGAMAPPAANSAQRKPKPKAKRAPNRDVQRVASTSEAASENDELTDASNNTTKTGTAGTTPALYKSKKCREKLRNGNGFVHMYLYERELFSNRRGPYHGLNEESETWIRDLKGYTPETARNDLFESMTLRLLLRRIDDKNEDGVMQNLQDLVCPVVAKLAVLNFHDDKLGGTYDLLEDLWNEQWIKLPTVLPDFGGPKPDYCVGFALSAFTEDRKNKIDIIASENKALRPTHLVYFPFLTCEVKSWQQSIDFAENQNGHNIFVAVLAMVELFRMANMDVSGQILAFSISFNHSLVYMHAYYPVITGEKTNICRHSLGTFLLSPSENPDSWRSWRLVRNVYEMWAPDLFKRLCEAIDSVKLDEAAAAAAPDPQATPALSDSVVPMDVQSDTTPRPDDMSTDGRSGNRAAPRESGQQPSPKRARIR